MYICMYVYTYIYIYIYIYRFVRVFLRHSTLRERIGVFRGRNAHTRFKSMAGLVVSVSRSSTMSPQPVGAHSRRSLCRCSLVARFFPLHIAIFPKRTRRTLSAGLLVSCYREEHGKLHRRRSKIDDAGGLTRR